MLQMMKVSTLNETSTPSNIIHAFWQVYYNTTGITIWRLVTCF